MYQIGSRVIIKQNLRELEFYSWMPLLDEKTGVVSKITKCSDGCVYEVEMDESFMIDRPHYVNEQGEFQHAFDYKPIPERLVEEKRWAFGEDELLPYV